MNYPRGLPSWIVNLKLKYLEPVRVPEKLEEYFFYLYLRADVDNVEQKFLKINLSPKRLERLKKLHAKDFEKYKKVFQQWSESRKTSQLFLELEEQMQVFQRPVDFKGKDDVDYDDNFQIRDKSFSFLPLPIFIANQFLFLDEPVKPPDNVVEYFCYYYFTNSNLCTFDEDWLYWNSKWKSLNADRRKIIMDNFELTRENFYFCHDAWKRSLNSNDCENFAAYEKLREQIKLLIKTPDLQN